jgi:prolyl oligopeptidase
MRASRPDPPDTRTEDVFDWLHGVRVADPYRWLEDGDSAEVRAWTEAQGRYAREVLDALPGIDAVRRRLGQLFSIGTVSPPSGRRGRYFHERRDGSEEQPRLLVRDSLHGADRLLLDPAAEAGDGAVALDWYYPGPDGRLVACGLSEGGSEKSVLRIRDAETGHDLPDAIPHTRACSLEWLPDGSGFFYTRYPDPATVAAGEENYHRSVFEHVLGRDWRDDPLVFEAREAEDWPSVHLSPDGRLLAVSVSKGWTRTDVYLRDLSRGPGFATVVEGEEALCGVILRNDRLYLLSNRGAPRFRLVAADPHRPEPAAWTELVPESDDVIEAAEVVGDRIVLQRLRDASSRVTLHDLSGRLLGEVPLPSLGSVAGLTGEWDGHEAFLGFSSYTMPPRVLRIPLPKGGASTWSQVEAPVDLDAFRVDLVRYRSRDTTPVSMFLVRLKNRPPGSEGPGVLTGYGGFNVSLTPAFGRGLLHFLESGGLYAVAHLRGGGEYGDAWHRAGMLGNKQNAFDDFIAAAEWLVAERHVGRERLAILGGSNGGLLVGAALTQRPDLFRAVVCQVPLLDMVRYHRFRIGRLWIPEYGSAEDPEAFRWLLAYSPYHRVQDGTAYPAVLLTTGEADSRVDPMHARKMTARLQAASSSERPVLLRMEGRAGHGQGKPISKVVEEWTDVWAFVLSELGMA